MRFGLDLSDERDETRTRLGLRADFLTREDFDHETDFFFRVVTERPSLTHTQAHQRPVWT